MEEKFKNIVNQFSTNGTITKVLALGAGHINDSYKVYAEGENQPKYVLQRINHHIFKDVEGLQQNILRVTNHIRQKLISRGVQDIERKVLALIPAKDGKLFFCDADGNYWRMYHFIQGSKSYDAIDAKFAYIAGRAFGDFQAMLADIPGDPLVETIPNFHNMETRLDSFRQSVKDNAAKRLEKVQWMVDELEERADEMCKAERLHREGKLPKRINHCDTKVNNVLFDEKTDEVLCVVDLDTVMPGYVLSDFGDFVRTGANTGSEDDENLDNISVNLDVVKAYLKGYLENAKSFLTPIEIDNLIFGAKLLTYMQTVRFFTDYLNGDTYYKIKHPEHNWQRTLAQFKLLQSIEEKYDTLKTFTR